LPICSNARNFFVVVFFFYPAERKKKFVFAAAKSEGGKHRNSFKMTFSEIELPSKAARGWEKDATTGWRSNNGRRASKLKKKSIDANTNKHRRRHKQAGDERTVVGKRGTQSMPTEKRCGGGGVIYIRRKGRMSTKRNRTSGAVGAPAGGVLGPGATGPLVVPPIVGAMPPCGELVGVVTGAGEATVGPVAGPSVTVVRDG